jgi:hypothetical protein
MSHTGDLFIVGRAGWRLMVKRQKALGIRPGASLAERPRFTSERLFQELDGRKLRVLHTDWTIEVYSIYEEAGARWLQLRLGGTPEHTLTVRATAGDAVERILGALADWLVHPSKIHDVLDVA